MKSARNNSASRRCLLENLESRELFASISSVFVDFFTGLRTVEVSFDDEAEAFRNINTREELGKA